LGLAPYVDRIVAEAEDAGAVAIIVEIDTPGGRVDAVIQIRDALLDAGVRTVALVDSTAYSAGALVAIASDEIYMTPGAVMGAATPVLGGTGEVADEKTISAVRAAFEAAAEENGRDPRIAAAMVDARIEVEGLVGDEELLTLTASQAIEFGYAEGTVADLGALLDELGLDADELVETAPGLAEQVVRLLTNPLLAGLFLLGGFLLIIGDFFSGGLGVAALGGVALLAVFFWGHLLAGLAGWEDVVLVLLGIGLIAVEVFVIPGFGVAGVLGLAALAGGAFMAMLYRDFDFVTTDDMWRAGLTVAVTLVAAVIGLVALIVFVSRHGAPSGLVLATRVGPGETLPERTSSGWLRWFDGDARLEPDRIARPRAVDVPVELSLVGATGESVSDLRPGGIAEIGGERVDVVTSGEFLPAGTQVEVIRDDRYRRVVRRMD
ncbi:MAG: ATP-dependent Clp protease proteolytic subunit, partial [Dehalococcoidia bacterium]|nr:ATP-dependent Clp protease proteolytic subunit [Dehalococcoidia bacterium]